MYVENLDMIKIYKENLKNHENSGSITLEGTKGFIYIHLPLPITIISINFIQLLRVLQNNL